MTSLVRFIVNDHTPDRKKKHRGRILETAAAQTRAEVQADKNRTVRERLGRRRRRTMASTVRSVFKFRLTGPATPPLPMPYLSENLGYRVLNVQLGSPVLAASAPAMTKSPQQYTWRDCKVLLHYLQSEAEAEARVIPALREAVQRHAELVRSDV